MDVNNVCVACLSNDASFPLFNTECVQEESTLLCSEMLQFCYDKYMSLNENFPQNICSDCIEDLHVSYNFIKKCEKSYLKICEYLSDVKTEDKTSCLPALKFENEEYLEESYQNEDNENKISDGCVMLLAYDDDNIEQSVDGNENENSQQNNEIVSVKKEVVKRRKRQPKNKEYDPADHICKICHKTFKDLRYHVKHIHEGPRAFQCERCAAIFKKNYTLQLHMKEHTNELPFPCTHPGCGKAFPIPSRLRGHVKSAHSKERPYMCQYCSHSSKTNQQLIIHIRYHHTKERKFVCSYCGKGFMSPQDKNMHEKKHMNVRAYTCKLCDKSFVYSGTLRSHMFSHSGIKNHACRICGKKFARKEHRKRHEKAVHGVTNKPESETGEQLT